MSVLEGERATPFSRYAEWYDAFNPAKDYDAETAFLLQTVHAISGPPRTWLDIGCGTGRHLAAIESHQIAVEGLDRSPSMIEEARRTHAGIRFHVGTAQDFTLEGERDVVSMLFHVMSYQHSDEMVRLAMERVGAHLAPQGVFLFDFWHSEAVVSDPPVARVRQTIVEGRSLFRSSRPVEDRSRRLIEVRYQFRWDSPEGQVAHEEMHVMRHFTARELDAFLRDSGMSMVRGDAWMTDHPLSSSDWYGFICARRDMRSG